MKVLLVEDDEVLVELFREKLGVRADIVLTDARSKDSAMSALGGDSFDLFVVDLHIPTVDGALDASEDHGLATYTELHARAMGTPTIVFSAFGTIKLATRLVSEAPNGDAFGDGHSLPLARFIEKTDLQDCLDAVVGFADQVAKLEEIEISVEPLGQTVPSWLARALRVFARQMGGTHARAKPLTGGLSGSSVYLVQVEDDESHILSRSAAKLSSLDTVDDEVRRFEQFVTPILPPGSFPQLIRRLHCGCFGHGGLFFGLALEHPHSLGECIGRDADDAAKVVDRLTAIEQPWQQGSVQRRKVGTVRETMFETGFDGVCGRLPFDWTRLEDIEVRIRMTPQHGDLHAFNVLLKPNDEPLLIDFGRTGHYPAALDPVTLELSIVFHPDFESLRGAWPSVDQAKHWDDLDIYTEDAPFASFIRACRVWATSVAAGNDEVWACVYAYAVRQLKFPDTNHLAAVAIAESACAKLFH